MNLLDPTPPAARGWLVVASAKGIQDYILRGHRLGEMAGASELVDQLPDRLLKSALDRLPSGAPARILASGAGSFRVWFPVGYAGAESDARTLARLWPLLVAEFAPGVEITVSVVSAERTPVDTIPEGERRLIVHRNRPLVDLPVAGPCVAYNPRTGLPGLELESTAEPGENRRPLDRAAARQRAMAGAAQSSLLRRVVPPSAEWLLAPSRRASAWPLDVSRIVREDNAYLAVVHADANGMGSAVMKLLGELEPRPEHEQVEFYERFCRAVASATEGAVQEAFEGCLPRWTLEDGEAVPIRPVVVAGEDVTVLVRADCALEFVSGFLASFERLSQVRLGELGIPQLRQGLTACAGVVYCKKTYPFARAYGLAEALCAFAKRESGRGASAVAFTRLKTALHHGPEYEDLVTETFRARDGSLLTMNPYYLAGEGAVGRPTLEGLRRLQAAGENLPRGPRREMVSLGYLGRHEAREAFERCRLVVSERDPADWKVFAEALRALTGTDDLWTADPPARTPLYDALELDSVEGRPPIFRP